MSQQPVTHEGVLEMMRESTRQFRIQLQEQGAEFDRRIKIVDKKISDLGNRIGEIVENMIGGNIIDKFKSLGYEIVQYNRYTCFGTEATGIGEVDLFLEDGDVAILIEVKTTLTATDVRNHIERMEKYRRHADSRNDKRHFIGAVAGAVVREEAKHIAHNNGMYVIVQSGDAVEILSVPEGFQAKEW